MLFTHKKAALVGGWTVLGAGLPRRWSILQIRGFVNQLFLQICLFVN